MASMTDSDVKNALRLLADTAAEREAEKGRFSSKLEFSDSDEESDSPCPFSTGSTTAVELLPYPA